MAIECPKGMMPVSSGGVIYPDEPDYCIHKDPATRGDYEKDYFSMAVKIWDGSKYVTYGPYGLTPEERNKPATNMTWDHALQHCQSQFEGGSLPTVRQWLKGCVIFCNTSGHIALDANRFGYHFAMFDLDDHKHPMITKNEWNKWLGMATDVLIFRNIFGQPREWLLNDAPGDHGWYKNPKYVGIVWSEPQVAGGIGFWDMKYPNDWLGFRCVAPPQKQKIEK